MFLSQEGKRGRRKELIERVVVLMALFVVVVSHCVFEAHQDGHIKHGWLFCMSVIPE